MAVQTKVEPIEDFVQIAVNDMLSPQARSQAIAAFATERVDEAKTINAAALGRAPAYKAAVDGRVNAPFENVNPDHGVISVEFEMTAYVIEVALDELRKASPVHSGDYARAHTLFINGVAVDTVPEHINPSDEIMIANPLPYARRLEIGVTKSGRPFVVQVPPRIYERVGRALQARFGNVAKFKVNTAPGVALSGAYNIKGVVGTAGISARHASGGRLVKRRTHAGEQVKSPALMIDLR